MMTSLTIEKNVHVVDLKNAAVERCCFSFVYHLLPLPQAHPAPPPPLSLSTSSTSSSTTTSAMHFNARDWPSYNVCRLFFPAQRGSLGRTVSEVCRC